MNSPDPLVLGDPRWTNPELSSALVRDFLLCFETTGKYSYGNLKECLQRLKDHNPVYALLALEDPFTLRLVDLYLRNPKLPKVHGGAFSKKWPKEWDLEVLQHSLMNLGNIYWNQKR